MNGVEARQLTKMTITNIFCTAFRHLCLAENHRGPLPVMKFFFIRKENPCWIPLHHPTLNQDWSVPPSAAKKTGKANIHIFQTQRWKTDFAFRQEGEG